MTISRRSLFGAVAAIPAAYEYAVASATASSGGFGLRAPAGHLVVVGRDVLNDISDSRLVAWSDPATGSWECLSNNQAGWWQSPYAFTGPARLERDGTIVVPSSAGLWRMTYIGQPYIYSFELTNVSAQPMEAI